MTREHYPSLLLKYFGYKHLPEKLQSLSQPFCELAHEVVDAHLNRKADYTSTEETIECLRKLLEAKDCAVRAALGSVLDLSDEPCEHDYRTEHKYIDPMSALEIYNVKCSKCGDETTIQKCPHRGIKV